MSSTQTGTNGQDGEAAGLDFLDFLFTAVLALGLTPEAAQREGILSQDWVKQDRLPSGVELDYLLVFVLGLVNLTLSWFGYHASIKSKPLKYKSIFGLFRFQLDIVLVIAYGFMFLQFKYPTQVVWIMVGIYAVFVVWDVFKIIEYWQDRYKGKSPRFYAREMVTLLMFVVFLGTAWLMQCDVIGQTLAIVACIVASYVYRLGKFFANRFIPTPAAS